MNKWIKFLKEYDGKAVGEMIETDAKMAEVLVKSGFAVEATEDEVKVAAQKIASKATELAGDLKTYVDTLVKEAGDGLVNRIAKEFKGLNDRRPHIESKDNEDEDPTFGFKSVGEQVRSVKDWYLGKDTAKSDERVKRIIAKAPTTYANEGLGADGGFLLAPTFSNEVLSHTFTDESLFSRTDTYTTASNNLTVPKDETTPWGTNGVQVYWTAEASQLTQSKPKLGQDNLILQKLTALVPVTDEQLQDSFVGLGQYVTKQASERIMWAVDDAIVNGGGVGKPLGIINSGALVQQAAEGGQTAATINLNNLAKMISRIPQASIKNLVWLVHPSAFPQLVVLTNGNSSLYIAPGGVSSANPNFGTLFGIPVIISQHCQAVGTPGDIFLFDMSKYITLTKGDGIQTAMSMHLFFDYNISTFRFNFRVAGQPWLQSAITSAYGSYSMSPFVDLATR